MCYLSFSLLSSGGGKNNKVVDAQMRFNDLFVKGREIDRKFGGT